MPDHAVLTFELRRPDACTGKNKQGHHCLQENEISSDSILSGSTQHMKQQHTQKLRPHSHTCSPRPS